MKQQVQTEYKGYRAPGIRLMEPLLPNIISHLSDDDAPLLYCFHAFDKAHLTMLAEEELIPREDALAMLRALRDMEAKGVNEVRIEVGGGMHSGEQYVIRQLGEEVGGRIHLGRSSGDLTAVGRRIRQRDLLIELMQDINKLRAALIGVAEESLDAVMPGYTHTQHAQPVTFGHQILSWASILERDFDRSDSAYDRVNESPAGAAIMTGSNFPLNRQRTAELMGFDRPIRNTFDAILSKDTGLDTFFAVASVNLNLSRWAADMNFWFSSEAAYIDVPDRFCGTSSIMMQKKNPYALEYQRGAAAESIGGLVTAFTALKAATGDTIMDPMYMFQALWRSFALAIRGLRWYTDLLPALELKRERMLEMAGSFWAQATDVAGALVTHNGMPWRTAHQIVGILVRHSYERGLKPRQVTTEMLDEAAMEYMGKPVGLSKQLFEKALDPVEFVNARTLYGGPSPEECRRRIPEYKAQLEANEKSLTGRQQRLEEARVKQERAIDALLA